jgi:hypothetical protein
LLQVGLLTASLALRAGKVANLTSLIENAGSPHFDTSKSGDSKSLLDRHKNFILSYDFVAGRNLARLREITKMREEGSVCNFASTLSAGLPVCLLACSFDLQFSEQQNIGAKVR